MSTATNVAMAPVIAAPVSAEPVNAQAEALREEKFRRDAAARLRTDPQHRAPEIVMAEMAAEADAFDKALADPQFVTALTGAYTQAMGARANVIGPISNDNASKDVIAILEKRRAAARELGQLLAQPEFRSHITHRAQAPEPEQAKPPILTADKQAEIVDRLVQPNDPRGPEAVIHDHFAAIGQRIGHQALIDVFQSDGKLQIPLMAALQRALPEAPTAQLQRMAVDWLEARDAAAIATTAAFAEDGPIIPAALTQATALQQQKLGLQVTKPAPSFAERARTSQESANIAYNGL